MAEPKWLLGTYSAPVLAAFEAILAGFDLKVWPCVTWVNINNTRRNVVNWLRRWSGQTKGKS